MAPCVPEPLERHQRFPDLGHAGGKRLDALIEATRLWLAKLIETLEFRTSRQLSAVVLLIGGYGPLLCAVTFAAYLKQAFGADMSWDKTEKKGSIG